MTVAEDLADAGVSDALDLPLNELPLSVRLHNCLKNDGIKTLRDILTRPSGYWPTVPNLGPKCVLELREVAAYYGHAIDALVPKPTPPTLSELRAKLDPFHNERAREIWSDRQAGATYRAIGEKHGIGPERVRQILHTTQRRMDRLALFDRTMQDAPDLPRSDADGE